MRFIAVLALKLIHVKKDLDEDNLFPSLMKALAEQSHKTESQKQEIPEISKSAALKKAYTKLALNTIFSEKQEKGDEKYPVSLTGAPIDSSKYLRK